MKLLTRLEEGILSLILVAITSLAFFQVFARYVLHLPVPWLEEMARYLMVWMVFLGVGVAIQNKTHIGVELIEWIIPHRFVKKVNVALTVIIVGFSIVFLKIALAFFQRQLLMGQVSTAGQYSMGWVYSAIVTGSILMIIHGCYRLFLLLYEGKSLE